MKGNISLKSFIEEVKKELKDSINDSDQFFIMGDVELEVSFALDAEASAGAKLFVIDVGGKTKASQTHKVKLTLTPFVEAPANKKPKPKSNNQATTEASKAGFQMPGSVADSNQRATVRAPIKRTRPTAQAPIVTPTAPIVTPTKPSTRRTRPTVSGGNNPMTVSGNKNQNKT